MIDRSDITQKQPIFELIDGSNIKKWVEFSPNDVYPLSFINPGDLKPKSFIEVLEVWYPSGGTTQCGYWLFVMDILLYSMYSHRMGTKLLKTPIKDGGYNIVQGFKYRSVCISFTLLIFSRSWTILVSKADLLSLKRKGIQD